MFATVVPVNEADPPVMRMKGVCNDEIPAVFWMQQEETVSDPEKREIIDTD
jgi:hypothetical protein